MPNIGITRILNYNEAVKSVNELQGTVTIIDFFGTWCIPCLKALPSLTALQTKYRQQVSVLLVSEEAVTKLENFIKKRDGFSLPVIVDEKKEFTNTFQPPAYPYTVVLDKNGRIISLTTPEGLTEANIEKWLTDQPNESSTNSSATVPPPSTIITEKRLTVEKPNNALVQLSQDFMYAAKTHDEITGFVKQLQQLSILQLQGSLKTDEDKKAFWINLYNAYVQVLLKDNPDQYKKRSKFFGSNQINIAGRRWSLDVIEHGILRRSKIKWSLGYFSKLFANKTEKRLRVDKLDYRVHFALNCGAKSCPPVAFYKPETINKQLDLATAAYLRGESEYDEKTNMLQLPAILGWFRRDFGGKKNMIKLVKQLDIVPADKNPTIKFKSYDWTLYLQNYKS